MTVESDLEIKTPDGTCNAAFIHPESDSHPGVLIWSDAFGLRPAMRDIAKRVAAEGYAVLVPNPFYRVTRDPFSDASNFNFENPANREKLRQLRESIFAPGNAEKDAAAYIEFLDSRKEVACDAKIGVQGYCMGGPLVVRTAASSPERVGAAASFHGGALVTDKPDSPHLLAPRVKARMYFGIAGNDDARQPEAKDKLNKAFVAAHVPAQIEVYAGTMHGWCIPDMPKQDGVPVYDRPAAELAFEKLFVLYKSGLGGHH